MSGPIVVFGGTFDPIHYGHLRLAWEVSEALQAEVRMLPSNIPAHRCVPVATPAQRLAMLELALAGQSRLIIDDRELRREGPSYAYDTLKSFREEFGNERALIFVLGMDAFAGLASWYRWRDIFDIAHLCVLRRPGYSGSLEQSLALEWESRYIEHLTSLRAQPNGNVCSMAITQLDISASHIRSLIARGASVNYLLPEKVSDFINLNRLYLGLEKSNQLTSRHNC